MLNMFENEMDIPTKEDRENAEVSDSALLPCSVAPCREEKHKGQPCDCAGCNHVDGVCISHESGSDCAACAEIAGKLGG